MGRRRGRRRGLIIQMSKRLAEEPAERDHSEKKKQLAEEPEYSDRVFEEALEELKAEKAVYVEKVKTMRRLVKEFTHKMAEAKVLDVVSSNLRCHLEHTDPENAPVPLRPITAHDVGSQAAMKLRAMIYQARPDANDQHPVWGRRKAEWLIDYINQACVPCRRDGNRILPIKLATDSAKAIGLVKIIDYLPRLKKMSAKFHAKFKVQSE